MRGWAHLPHNEYSVMITVGDALIHRRSRAATGEPFTIKVHCEQSVGVVDQLLVVELGQRSRDLERPPVPGSSNSSSGSVLEPREVSVANWRLSRSMFTVPEARDAPAPPRLTKRQPEE